MSDHALAASHIDQLENRLASLHELGVDTAGLRSQLAFARTQLNEGRIAEVLGICEEVATTARRLADGSQPPERQRTGRFTRDQLGEAIHDLLSQGLFAKLLAEQRSGPDVRLEARLSTLEERLRTHLSHEADALRAEQQVLREEMDLLRRSIGTAAATPSAEVPAGDERAQTATKEPLWAARLHSILVKAIRRSDAQAAQIASIVQHITEHATAAATSPGLEQAVAALRGGLAEDLRVLSERQQPAVGESTASDSEPAWASALGTTLQAVAERLQSAPPAPAGASEPAWAHSLRDALQAVAVRLESRASEGVPTEAAAAEVAEPAWSLSLRDALAGAEDRHQALLTALATRTPGVDSGFGEQLAGALERGLLGLGAALGQRPSRVVQQQMDDSNSALSPVSVGVADHATTRSTAQTPTRSESAAGVESMGPEQIRQLVAREIETLMGSQHTEVISGTRKPPVTERIRALVSAEYDVRQGGAIERTGRSDVGDLRATLLRLLPELLADEGVRQSLFTVLALEAVAKPGILSELTGLRSFLRRELAHAAEDLTNKLQPA